MRLQMNREWFEREVKLEEGQDVSAGLSTFPAEQKDKDLSAQPAAELTGCCTNLRVVGKLVNLRRRERGLTLEALAEKADLELDEVCAIDSGRWEHPKPRTIQKVASVLDLPPRKLMQLSGLVQARDRSLQDAALHFAARAQDLEALTPEESRALQEFVRYLSEG